MTGRTHRLIGASGGFIAMSAVGLPIGVCIAAGGVVGATSSLPDQFEKVLHVKHRRLTHYPLLQIGLFASIAAAMIALAAAPEEPVLVLAGAAALGCVIHSVADSMTIDARGIALLWPISRRGYHLMPRPLRVEVGSKSRSEWVFAACWCAFVLCYVYVRYRHYIPALSKHA
jgi:membrane-bound metal-dependent hydrolase YbcI (DUF457 family)